MKGDSPAQRLRMGKEGVWGVTANHLLEASELRPITNCTFERHGVVETVHVYKNIAPRDERRGRVKRNGC
jgi:hypothetical protein